MNEQFLKMFASLFAQNGAENGSDKMAHQLVAAQSFAAAAQMIQSSLGDGVSLVAELRKRAQETSDVADLVEAALAPKPEDDKGENQDKEAKDERDDKKDG